VTEEEITGLLREGTNAGLFEKTEHEIVSRALRLDDQSVAALMTPRMDVHFVDLDDPLETTLLKIADSAYNRFPVCRGDLSQVVGVVHAGSLFEQMIRGQPIDIQAATKPPLLVPETISAMQLLETLKKNRAELALVIDEYGEIEGIVTLSDVLGALVGDVSVIDEDHEEDAVRREDGSWLVDAGISFQRFREVFKRDVYFPDETSGAYHTLAGFVLDRLGHIPEISEHFEWDGYRIEVVDMDRNRIDRLLISKIRRSSPRRMKAEVPLPTGLANNVQASPPQCVVRHSPKEIGFALFLNGFPASARWVTTSPKWHLRNFQHVPDMAARRPRGYVVTGPRGEGPRRVRKGYTADGAVAYGGIQTRPSSRGACSSAAGRAPGT
jgi:Mg2+/Co2+ transporter CorC